MPKTYDARLIKAVGEATTARNGEMIVIGLRFGKPESREESEDFFALPYDLMTPLVARLVDAASKANALRERNPLHAGGPDLGTAFKLENGAIGPSARHKGEHILECDLRAPGNETLKYRIRADREGLETLRALLAWYLETPEGQGRETPPAH